MTDTGHDHDPQDVIEAPGYTQPDEDPTDPEVTDPDHPDFVEPGVDYPTED